MRNHTRARIQFGKRLKVEAKYKVICTVESIEEQYPNSPVVKFHNHTREMRHYIIPLGWSTH